MLTYEELTEPERAVWNAMEAGALVALPIGAAAADNPASGETWGEDRQVRAQLLYELLAGVNGVAHARPRALRLAGARITGTLDLEATALVCPLTLYGCSFERPINVREARAPAMRLPGCHTPGLAGDQFQTRGNLELHDGFSANGEVSLLGGHIGGQLNFSGAVLTNPEGIALAADRLTVDHSMFCGAGFSAHGEVRLLGGHIGGQLNLSDATLINPEGAALTADGLTVDQGVVCQEGLTAQGEVSLLGGHIGGQLNFSGAVLTNPEGAALTADGLTVDHSMFCGAGFSAHGEVRLLGGHIGGNLEFNGATLTNPDGVALAADGLTVDQGMYCREGFVAQGEVRLVDAHIHGTLSFVGATVTNPKGTALTADKLIVDQSMLCREGFTAQGEVRLVGAHIGSNLELFGATLTNPNRRVLTADTLIVEQNMFCRGLSAQGVVRLPGAHIGGQLEFTGANLSNPRGMALSAEGLIVDQSMHCGEGFSARGEVHLIAARIAGQLDFGGATLANPGGTALDLESIRTASLFLRPEAPPEGTVDLTNADADSCYDSQATWPQDLHLDGFTYRTLRARPEVDATMRLRWLERDPRGYTPQLYEQLVAAYRKAGRDDDARKVAIAKQRRRRQTLSWPGKAWNSLLRWTVGYGYQTWKAGAWLLILIGLGWWIFDRAHPAHLFAAKPPGQRPSFHAGLYAMDLLLPFADLGYQSAWIAGGWARGLYLGWNLAGWVLITAVVAALSGLIKRD